MTFGLRVLGKGDVRVTVDTAGAADVDDAAGLAVFDAEVGARGADELEGGGVVEGEDGVPLFVCHLKRLGTWDG